MSKELKAHTIYTPMDDVAHDEKGRIMEGKEVYLKTDVDAVLAEKDKEIRRLTRAFFKVCANWFCCRRELAARNALYDEELKNENFAETCRAMVERFGEGK